MSEAVFFYLFSALAIVSALYVVTTKHPTYSVLSLVVTMFSLAVLFVLLRAYFIAVVHLLVYAGAILVLFLFVVMLLGVARDESSNRTQMMLRIFGGLVFLGFLAEVGIVARSFLLNEKTISGVEGTIEAVGKLLFTQYLLPFEITSILLLVGIIGAVVLAKKETV